MADTQLFFLLTSKLEEVQRLYDETDLDMLPTPELSIQATDYQLIEAAADWYHNSLKMHLFAYYHAAIGVCKVQLEALNEEPNTYEKGKLEVELYAKLRSLLEKQSRIFS